ncbi:MAG: trehalose-phosphatase [Actinomycetota bacterium]
MPPADLIDLVREQPETSGFVLDFDGTLSPIVPEPDRAAPVPGAAERLAALAARYRMVALVSGRRARDLERRVGADGIRYVGLYGAETSTNGRVTQSPKAARWRAAATAIADEADAFLAREGLAGCTVERKDLTVSIHYRNAQVPDAAQAVEAWAAQRAASDGFAATRGRMVIELRPHGMTKARAVEDLVLEYSLTRIVIAGDDAADLEMFDRVTEMLGGGALRVGVSSAEQPARLESASDLLVSGPDEVVELLGRFL